MKHIFKIFIFAYLLLSSYSGYAQANKEKNILVKCHVELIGGGETIYFTYVKPSKINQQAKILRNRELKRSIVKGVQRIYQVNECVPENVEFTDSSANQLFKKTLR